MKAEAQRVVIAEACGWVYYPEHNHGFGGWGCCKIGQPVTSCDRIPDYLSDLNAMHEAEKVFYSDPDKSVRYAEFILDVLEIPHAFVGGGRCAFLTNHATAAQRAEAFLRAIGKWEEDK